MGMPVVSTEIEYGDGTGEPNGLLSSVNWTVGLPETDVTLAAIVTVPVSVALLSGAAIETVMTGEVPVIDMPKVMDVPLTVAV